MLRSSWAVSTARRAQAGRLPKGSRASVEAEGAEGMLMLIVGNNDDACF